MLKALLTARFSQSYAGSLRNGRDKITISSSRLVHCEARNSRPASKTELCGLDVCHLSKVPQNRNWVIDNPRRMVKTPIRTPMKLPENLCGLPPPFELSSTVGTCHHMLVPVDATSKDAKKLAREQPSSLTLTCPQPSNWILPASIHQQTCNHPVEDRGVLDQFKSKSGKVYFFAAVIDGHSGWQVSEYVSRALGDRIANQLESLEQPQANVEEVLQRVFLDLDTEIWTAISKSVEMGFSKNGRPGATSNVVLISPEHIYSMNLGDSVSFISRNGSAFSLASAHNAGEKKEQEILLRKHPNEADVFECHYEKKQLKKQQERRNSDLKDSVKPNSSAEKSYLNAILEFPAAAAAQASTIAQTLWEYLPLGSQRPAEHACYTKGRLQLTRALGDFYLKTPAMLYDFQDDRAMLNSPVSYPYVSSKPEVNVILRDSAKDDFVFIASDGVWDFLNEQEVCDLIWRCFRRGQSTAVAVEEVKAEVMRRAARASNTSVELMLNSSPQARRKQYDDITCALVDLR